MSPSHPERPKDVEGSAPHRRPELLAQVSALYYLDGLTQADIGARLRLSRPKVSRLLCAARKIGIVRIAVKPPRGVFTLLEAELEDRFALAEVRVVPLASGRSPEWARRQLGAATASDFARTVRLGHTVGLVGQELIASMIDAVPAMTVSEVRVVQGVGWESASTQRSLMALVGELAQRIEGRAVTLTVPGIVASDAVRRGLEADPHIDDVLRALDRLDSLYVEVRTEVAGAILVPADAGATPVGHLARRHFDRNGRWLGPRVDGHVVGITVEQMRRAGHVVALAHGPASAPAIAAALRTGLIGTFITDELTARAIAALRRRQVEPVFHTSAGDERSIQ